MQSLSSCKYFHELSEITLANMAQELDLRGYKTGEMIFWQDEPCAGLFILKSGSVKLFRLSASGRELIVRILSSGETFNEVPCFDHGTNVVSAAALENSSVWVLENGLILRSMLQYPEVMEAFNLSLASNLRRMVGMVEELTFYQVTNRMARLIYEQLNEQTGCKGASVQITQNLLAARLGTVREVAARSLKELERSGAIQVRRCEIQVINWEVLAGWLTDN